MKPQDKRRRRTDTDPWDKLRIPKETTMNFPSIVYFDTNIISSDAKEIKLRNIHTLCLDPHVNQRSVLLFDKNAKQACLLNLYEPEMVFHVILSTFDKAPIDRLAVTQYPAAMHILDESFSLTSVVRRKKIVFDEKGTPRYKKVDHTGDKQEVVIFNGKQEREDEHGKEEDKARSACTIEKNVAFPKISNLELLVPIPRYPTSFLCYSPDMGPYIHRIRPTKFEFDFVSKVGLDEDAKIYCGRNNITTLCIDQHGQTVYWTDDQNSLWCVVLDEDTKEPMSDPNCLHTFKHKPLAMLVDRLDRVIVAMMNSEIYMVTPTCKAREVVTLSTIKVSCIYNFIDTANHNLGAVTSMIEDIHGNLLIANGGPSIIMIQRQRVLARMKACQLKDSLPDDIPASAIQEIVRFDSNPSFSCSEVIKEEKRLNILKNKNEAERYLCLCDCQEIAAGMGYDSCRSGGPWKKLSNRNTDEYKAMMEETKNCVFTHPKPTDVFVFPGEAFDHIINRTKLSNVKKRIKESKDDPTLIPTEHWVLWVKETIRIGPRIDTTDDTFSTMLQFASFFKHKDKFHSVIMEAFLRGLRLGLDVEHPTLKWLSSHLDIDDLKACMRDLWTHNFHFHFKFGHGPIPCKFVVNTTKHTPITGQKRTRDENKEDTKEKKKECTTKETIDNDDIVSAPFPTPNAHPSSSYFTAPSSSSSSSSSSSMSEHSAPEPCPPLSPPSSANPAFTPYVYSPIKPQKKRAKLTK